MSRGTFISKKVLFQVFFFLSVLITCSSCNSDSKLEQEFNDNHGQNMTNVLQDDVEDKLNDSVPTEFSLSKLSDTSYALWADGQRIGVMNIEKNWVFFNDLYKNDTDRFIAQYEYMSPLSISWPQLKGYELVIDEISFHQFKPNYASLEVKMHFYMDVNGVSNVKVTHDTVMIIWKNKSNGFYSYEIQSSLNLPKSAVEAFFKTHEKIEYQDILPDGIFTFPVHNNKWKWWGYFDNGQTYLLPLHHHNIYNELPIPSKGGTFFAFETDENVGNPFIKFRGENDNDYFILCTWAYDLHFFLDTIRAKKLAEDGKPIYVNYIISFKTADQIRNLFDNAKLSPIVESKRYKLPVYSFDHINGFEYSELYKTPNEHYFWYCFSDWQYCEWDLTQGYTGKGSLKVIHEFYKASSWKYAALSPSHMKNFNLNGQYSITAMTKVKGDGIIKIGWYDDKSKVVTYNSWRFSGETDWSLIKMQTPDTTGAYQGAIYLEFEGVGEAWFDDVKFEAI